jgi:hypothetical protein
MFAPQEQIMYRIETLVFLLAALPLLVAIIFRAAVVPDRKRTMLAALAASEATSDLGTNGGKEYVVLGRQRVSQEFESLYNARLIIPAALLSTLYLIGLSLGLQLAVALSGGTCPMLFCNRLSCLAVNDLMNPTAALLGCYVFNAGVLVRRSFAADITKTVFWSSINRVIFATGISIALESLSTFRTSAAVCFAVAFFPRIAMTWLKKFITTQLPGTGSEVQELDLQLVQGVDVWKEERLEEEGIESAQNLATADPLSLAIKTHYPLRTIIDWIDQAILIQRFPALFKKIQEIGLAISAIELSLMARPGNDEIRATTAGKLGLDPLILLYTIQCMYEDAAIQNLWRLWQTRDSDA